MASVRLEKVTKLFGDVRAVDDISFQVEEGEFFSLLGPSGCGKTTTLRMIAGFESPSGGTIFFGDNDVAGLKPQQRNIGMVFQNYALFPHMTVGENVAFGLKARKVEKSEISGKVRKALELVNLTGYTDRPVSAMSGGQQQRVALARALVIEPQILLLDEPLSNLDAKLRVETREQIRSLQKRLGITTFYVTHDQDEALSQSDRLAVLIAGKCMQIGEPREVFNQPRGREVMDFLGKANFLPGSIISSENGKLQVQISPQWVVALPLNVEENVDQIILGFRPHEVEFAAEGDAATIQAKVKDVIYTGALEEILLEHAEKRFVAQRSIHSGSSPISPGDVISIRIPGNALKLFPAS